MIDTAHKATEDKLKSLERKLKKEYYKAYENVSKQANEYFMTFAKKDEAFAKLVEDGKKTEQQYMQWRMNEMLIGEKWQEIERRMSIEYQNADKVAYSLIHNEMVDVYALNRNFIYKKIVEDTGIDMSFMVYDRKAVERLLHTNPNILPQPSEKLLLSLKSKGATLYNKKQIQGIATRAIISGDSIPDIAETISKELGQKNLNSSVRTARTMMTSAQNGARNDSLKDAEPKYKKYGIKLKKQWIATQDGRTRHSHRNIPEGVGQEIVNINEEFSNGLEYPGDTSGDPSEVYNCRCTMITVKEYE